MTPTRRHSPRTLSTLSTSQLAAATGGSLFESLFGGGVPIVPGIMDDGSKNTTTGRHAEREAAQTT